MNDTAFSTATGPRGGLQGLHSREIAIAASQEFGAPLLDLDAIQPDLEIIRLVSEKTIRKHRVLPLVKRGKRLFV
ncbi:MAG: type pilus assembly protein PilB, partial [Proteobacteria bacterium]|nr:type pilus assembly protein PilB [Pseudomonadota bacterium]